MTEKYWPEAWGDKPVERLPKLRTGLWISSEVIERALEWVEAELKCEDRIEELQCIPDVIRGVIMKEIVECPSCGRIDDTITKDGMIVGTADGLQLSKRRAEQ